MHCHALYLESSWKRKCPQESGLFCCNFPSRPGPVNANVLQTCGSLPGSWAGAGSGIRCWPAALGTLRVSRAARGAVAGAAWVSLLSRDPSPPGEPAGCPSRGLSARFGGTALPARAGHRQCAPLPGAAQRPQTHCPLPASSQGGC